MIVIFIFLVDKYIFISILTPTMLIILQIHIHRPMIFVFLFAGTPGSSDAFANFLLGPLGFTEDEYTYILALGMFSSALGAWIFKRYFKGVTWRRLFTTTLLVSSAFSFTQLILIFRLNK